MWANTIGLFVLLVAIPFMGRLSDRLGRKPLLLACCVAFIVVPLPVFSYLASGNASYGTLILVQAFFALLISMFSGPGPAAIAEIFPTKQPLDLDDLGLCARGRDLRRLRAATSRSG